MEVSILSYGAVGDGMTENSKSIQNAINECCANGGGRVTVPAGTFKTGSIELKSNIELYLEVGATLLASENLDDYNADDAYPQNFGVPSEGWNAKHLIYCSGQKNVSITGFGCIDGNGQAFFAENKDNNIVEFAWQYGWRWSKDTERLRPGQAIVFAECENVHVENITVRNTTSWSIYIYGCTHAFVYGVRILNPRDYLNTDGIDIDTSRYVTVSDCVILTGDDALTVRGNGKRLVEQEGRACEYVTVTNCVLRSSACAVRIGVGTFPIRHVRISDIVIERAGQGLCFCPEWLPSRGTPMEDISVSHVSAESVGCMLSLNDLHKTPVDNISVSDVFGNAEAAVLIDNGTDCEKFDISIHDFRVREIENYAIGGHQINLTEKPFARIKNVNADISGMVLTVKDKDTKLELDSFDGIKVRERK